MALTDEQKAKWCADLRSGNYAQTNDYLRDENGFCCLGVLGDQLDPDAWIPVEGNPIGAQRWVTTGRSFLSDDCYLPDDILDREVQDTLASLNDGERQTFAQIADYIEEGNL